MFKLSWKLLGNLTIIITIIISFITFENHFANSTDRKIQVLEKSTTQSLENFQIQQQINIDGLKLQILFIQKESLDTNYLHLKRLLKENPNDSELVEEINDVKIQRQLLKEKINTKIMDSN